MSLSSLLGGQAARICIRFSDAATRNTLCDRQPDGRDEEQYLFGASDGISGMVCPRHTRARSRRCDLRSDTVRVW